MPVHESPDSADLEVRLVENSKRGRLLEAIRRTYGPKIADAMGRESSDVDSLVANMRETLGRSADIDIAQILNEHTSP